MDYSKQIQGKLGEDLACDYLKSLGYKILIRNYTSPLGEIDLIAKDRGQLVFVEVKCRASLAVGHPWEAVTFYKRRQIIKCAKGYLKRYDLFDYPCRFDVVSVLAESSKEPVFEHFQNAFGE